MPERDREAIALAHLTRAVLYEGFALYPYRASSAKNARRILFGTLWPEAYEGGDRSRASAQMLVRGDSPTVRATTRFLRLEDPPREETTTADVTFERLAPDLARLTVVAANRTPIEAGASLEDAERLAFGAAHVVLEIENGSFVSVIDPPAELADIPLVQDGLHPVLLGKKGDTRTMLAAPIILYDHPEIAPESAGDLFDATEIEEILSLRVFTLTDAEKAELRADPRRRGLLERVESLSADDYARLHGAFRDRGLLRQGTRVRLNPRTRADAFDVLLRGMEATVQTIEHTVDGRELVCVTIDRDPGKDLGELGLPGHRFFFARDEMEVLA